MHLVEIKDCIVPQSVKHLQNISHVSAYITCHDGDGNATASDWSAVVMAWMVSLVCGQFRAHHIDCV